MTEKKEQNANADERSTIIVVLTTVVVVIGVVIAIPIVYATGRSTAQVGNVQVTNYTNDNFTNNECTKPLYVEPYMYFVNQTPFPFKYHQLLYKPSVVLKKMTLIFGFCHNDATWSLDKISVIDTTTQNETIKDGDFESNYLTQYYKRCVLSNTRSSTGDTLFDNPYSGDFYYNDQTYVGMTFIKQELTITGGRYYNITFYLENRGSNNIFVFAIGYNKNN